MELSDDKLIKGYLSGEPNSDALLYDKYADLIYSIVRNKIPFGATKEEIVHDIVQEVFIKIFLNVGKYNRNVCSFKNWICVIAKNTIIDFLRKNRELCFTDLDGTGDSSSLLNTLNSNVSVIDDVHGSIQLEKCYDGIKKFDPKVQEVIFLHIKGYTFKEIGIITEISSNTVKSQYNRAINKLKNIIKE